MIVIVLILSVLFALALYYLADKKGKDKIFWSVMGFMFGPLALVVLALIKNNVIGRKQDESL